MNETVLEHFPDLRQVGPIRLRVRVVRIEGQGEARLDIRIYKEGRMPTPWTWKGIRITAEEFAALVELAPKILQALSGEPTRRRRKKVTP